MPRSSKTNDGDVKTLGAFVQCSPDAQDTP